VDHRVSGEKELTGSVDQTRQIPVRPLAVCAGLPDR